MSTHHVAAETELMLAWLASHDGTHVDTFGETAVLEAIREGLVQRVTIGCDEPMLVLTPSGTDHALLGALDTPISPWRHIRTPTLS